MEFINALGQPCPIPVIMAKKALKATNDGITIAVDNIVATENLAKMAAGLGYSISVSERFDGNYDVIIDGTAREKTEQTTSEPVQMTAQKPLIITISADTMGRGDDKLGATLLKMFIHSVTELDVLPEQILFFNGGAKLTISGSAALSDLRELTEKGVKIATCGACLDFYGIKDELAIGEITNMFTIAQTLASAGNTIML